MASQARVLALAAALALVLIPFASFTDGSSLLESHEHDARCSVCHAQKTHSDPARVVACAAVPLFDVGSADDSDAAEERPLPPAASSPRAPPLLLAS